MRLINLFFTLTIVLVFSCIGCKSMQHSKAPSIKVSSNVNYFFLERYSSVVEALKRIRIENMVFNQGEITVYELAFNVNNKGAYTSMSCDSTTESNQCKILLDFFKSNTHFDKAKFNNTTIDITKVIFYVTIYFSNEDVKIACEFSD